MDESKVIFIIAFNGFQNIEYAIPKHIIESEGFAVVTASDRHGVAIAQNGSTTHVEVVLDKIIVNQYCGILFIGGPGALEHLDNHTSYKLLQEASQLHIPVGAICIATRILAKAGILSGKEATGWNDDEQLLPLYKEYNVIYADNDVVVDDNIITAAGPQAAQKFGELFVQMLHKKQQWG